MKRTANAHWNGTLQAGQGEISLKKLPKVPKLIASSQKH
jgi:hypothetical protein